MMGCGIQSRPQVTELYPTQGLLGRSGTQTSANSGHVQSQSQPTVEENSEITEVNTESYQVLVRNQADQNQSPNSPGSNLVGLPKIIQ